MKWYKMAQEGKTLTEMIPMNVGGRLVDSVLITLVNSQTGVVQTANVTVGMKLDQILLCPENYSDQNASVNKTIECNSFIENIAVKIENTNFDIKLEKFVNKIIFCPSKETEQPAAKSSVCSRCQMENPTGTNICKYCGGKI